MFIQHKSPEIVCNFEITFLSRLDIGISFKGLELVYSRKFGINWPQPNRGSGVWFFWFVGWMRGRLMYNNFLSPR
jgi:hypothetical protein